MLVSKLKLKERVMICVSAIFVVFTLFLVLDIQTDMGITRHHLMPSHGRIRYDTANDGPGSAYNSFRRRFLQKGNGSKESGGTMQGGGASQQQDSVVSDNRVTKFSQTTEKQVKEPHDDFRQLYDFVFLKSSDETNFVNGAFEPFIPKNRGSNPTLLHLLGIRGR